MGMACSTPLISKPSQLIHWDHNNPKPPPTPIPGLNHCIELGRKPASQYANNNQVTNPKHPIAHCLLNNLCLLGHGAWLGGKPLISGWAMNLAKPGLIPHQCVGLPPRVNTWPPPFLGRLPRPAFIGLSGWVHGAAPGQHCGPLFAGRESSEYCVQVLHDGVWYVRV